MRTISHYQVQDKPIGEGGMGRVLRGTDTNTGREVAIKEILPEFAADFEIRVRTEREVDLLERLSSNNIVKVYDRFPMGNNFYIVMEYVDGRNIEQYVGSYGAIPFDRAVRFMIEVLRTMQYVHENGIVHRDMKPNNIMIRSTESICILDFGIAKDLGSTGGTITGTVIGSDGYMSPEQASGYDIDHRADIYSLGCVLHYMLTGRHAYVTLASDFETRENIITQPFPRLAEHSHTAFPPRLQEVIDRATDKNMMKRYQSCREFQKDLESLIGGTAISAAGQSEITITVGRADCDILIHDDEQKVSRQHLDITYRQFTGSRTYTINDHSSNGTMVDGEVLHHGSKTIREHERPQVYLACNGAYPLDWDEVRRVIDARVQVISGNNPPPSIGATIGEPGGSTGDPGGGIVDSPEIADVSFADALKLFFTRCFDFDGRSRRKEYWYMAIWFWIFYLAALVSAVVLTGDALDAMTVIMPVIGVASFIALIPNLSLTVRRLHDIGKSGWNILWNMVPVVNFVMPFIFLYWMAKDSDPEENDYGPCPK